MQNKITKKGELTTQQLVMIIILILSFAIILFFIFRLNLGGTTEKEICHDSVVKNSNPILNKFSQEINCKTTDTCISGGGKCTDITADSTINVNVNSKDEIFKTIADEMADCWWMFGEGELDYIDKSKSACAICSIIDFDENIESAYPQGIPYKEFFDYLETPMNVQKSNEDYLYYIYGVNNVESLTQEYPVFLTDYQNNKISLKGRYMIRTGMVEEARWKDILGMKNRYIYPYFFRTDEIREPKCTEFITKS